MLPEGFPFPRFNRTQNVSLIAHLLYHRPKDDLPETHLLIYLLTYLFTIYLYDKLKIDKLVNGLNKNLFICLCYIIPSNSSRRTQVENKIYDLMSNDIISIKDTYGEENCLFMIMGDTNSRTGILLDYISFDNRMLLDNLLPDVYSIDHTRICHAVTKMNRLIKVDVCYLIILRSTGLKIANGRVCEDAYIYVGYNGSSSVALTITQIIIIVCILMKIIFMITKERQKKMLKCIMINAQKKNVHSTKH